MQDLNLKLNIEKLIILKIDSMNVNLFLNSAMKKTTPLVSVVVKTSIKLLKLNLKLSSLLNKKWLFLSTLQDYNDRNLHS